MRQYFLVFSLLLLASCSLPWQKDDFTSVQERHTEAQFSFLSQVEKALGLQFRGVDSGTMQAKVSIPEIMNAVLESDYTIRTAGRSSEFTFEKMNIGYADPTNSGNLILDNLKLLVLGGEAFMQIQNMSGSLSDPQIKPVLEKYKNQWIGLSDTATILSGATEDEQLAYTFSENLSSLSLDDLRDYSLKYPLWKMIREVPQEGKYSYDVELDKESVALMIKELGSRLTEKPLDAETEKAVSTFLASISLTGSLTIDRDNPLYADFDGYFSTPSNPEPIHIYTSHTASGFAFAFGTIGNTVKGNLAYLQEKSTITLGIVVTASGQELGKLDGAVVLDGRRIQDIQISMRGEGLEASIHHKSNQNGDFGGEAVLPTGNLSWTGTMRDERLSSLTLGGDAVGGKVSMNLVASGSRVVGPLRLTLDDEPVLSADVSTEIDNKSGKYGLSLDIISPEDPNVKTHVSFDITHKRTEDSSIVITKPARIVPYSVVSDEMSALLPTEEATLSESMSTFSGAILEADTPTIEEKDPR